MSPKDIAPVPLSKEALSKILDKEAADRSHREFIEKTSGDLALKHAIEQRNAIVERAEKERLGIDAADAKKALDAIEKEGQPPNVVVQPSACNDPSHDTKLEPRIPGPVAIPGGAAPKTKVDPTTQPSGLESPGVVGGGGGTTPESETPDATIVRELEETEPSVRVQAAGKARASRRLTIGWLLVMCSTVVLAIGLAAIAKSRGGEGADSETRSMVGHAPHDSTANVTATAAAPDTATAEPTAVKTSEVVASASASAKPSTTSLPTSRTAVPTAKTAATTAPPIPTTSARHDWFKP